MSDNVDKINKAKELLCRPMPWVFDPIDRYTTAPRNAEQALSLMSAGVGALASVDLTDEERGRIWRLIEKAVEAVGEVK